MANDFAAICSAEVVKLLPPPLNVPVMAPAHCHPSIPTICIGLRHNSLPLLSSNRHRTPVGCIHTPPANASALNDEYVAISAVRSFDSELLSGEAYCPEVFSSRLTGEVVLVMVPFGAAVITTGDTAGRSPLLDCHISPFLLILTGPSGNIITAPDGVGTAHLGSPGSCVNHSGSDWHDPAYSSELPSASAAE
jgi:hypothetical protein